MKNAEEGIKNLKNFVDTLLVIPNQKLIEVLDKNISFKRAFEIADDVLRQGVQGVSDVIANPELINLDFADVRTILSNKGLAHMGTATARAKRESSRQCAAQCSVLFLKRTSRAQPASSSTSPAATTCSLAKSPRLATSSNKLSIPAQTSFSVRRSFPTKRTSKSPSSQRDLWIETLLLQEAAHLNLKNLSQLRFLKRRQPRKRRKKNNPLNKNNPCSIKTSLPIDPCSVKCKDPSQLPNRYNPSCNRLFNPLPHLTRYARERNSIFKNRRHQKTSACIPSQIEERSRLIRNLQNRYSNPLKFEFI